MVSLTTHGLPFNEIVSMRSRYKGLRPNYEKSIIDPKDKAWESFCSTNSYNFGFTFKAAFGKLTSPTNLYQISTGDPASLFHSKISLLLDSHFPSGASPIPFVLNDCSLSCLSPSEVDVVFRKLRGGKAQDVHFFNAVVFTGARPSGGIPFLKLVPIPSISPRSDAALYPLGELDSLDSSRFPGSLNVDINEIVMNMTPYPRLHYLLSSMSPLFPLNDNCKVDQMFNEVFSASHQLFHCSPTQGILLASALLCRGQVAMSDVQNNIERFKGTVKFIPWNKEGWKIGLCNIPNIAYSRSMLMLSNTTSIIKDLSHLKENFLKMYRKKAHLHHFLEVECMEQDTFKYSLTDLQFLIEEYSNFESVTEASEKPRLKIKL
ncbi:tubulin epsilon chain [Trichonephila clavipes]|nr:tubulin epsilon chain [Trichonephila clavipes]